MIYAFYQALHISTSDDSLRLGTCNVYLRFDLTSKSAGNRSMSAGLIKYDWLFSLSDLFADFNQLKNAPLRERQSTMILRETH